MAGLYGDFTAKRVIQGDVAVIATDWVPLTASGTGGITTDTVPYPSRRQIRWHIKANQGGALAVQYVPVNPDGTFTKPTLSGLVKVSTVYPGNALAVEPIGDNIQVFGRLVKKKGFSFSSIRVVITEFA